MSGKFDFLNKEKVKFEKFKDRFISNFYSDVDRGHGKFHIETCYENGVYGYDKTPEINKDFDWRFTLLCVISHDIGLSIKTNALFGRKYRSNAEARALHHINGGSIFKELGKMTGQTSQETKTIKTLFPFKGDFEYFKEIVSYGNTLERGALAISEHRASVQQSTQLSQFLRCCDGLNTAKFIMKRSVLYHIDNHIGNNEREMIVDVKSHLMEKYCGPNRYSQPFKFEWAKVKFEKEILELRKILDSIDPENPESYQKYFDAVKNM